MEKNNIMAVNQNGGKTKITIKTKMAVKKQNGSKKQNGVSTCCELCVEVEMGGYRLAAGVAGCVCVGLVAIMLPGLDRCL